MRIKHLIILVSFTLLLAALVTAMPQTASTNPLFQTSTFRITDRNPVVNEGNPIALVAVDAAGQPVAGVTWESGSPDIASVDSATGTVRGVLQGYATITARRGSESDSVFVTVSRLSSRKGVKVAGDQKVDTSGAVYFSDPVNNVIFKRETPNSDPVVFAGKMGIKGRADGKRLDSQFAGPTAVSIDNRPQGGIYVADTLNHSIRKISFNDDATMVVTTVVGRGTPGINMADTTPFAQAAFSSPQGAAADAGGSVIVADTDNHAIYVVDFEKSEVRLLAGSPGVSGKADGKGRAALFNKPRAVAVQMPSSKFFGTGDPGGIFVADTGNNRVRLITRDGTKDGTVSTVGRIPMVFSRTIKLDAAMKATIEQTGNEFEFDAPTSVSVDAVGNLYVADKGGAKVLIQPVGQLVQMVSLGQPGSLKAMNVVVKGNEALVLDGNAGGNDDAVKAVTVGAPEIAGMSLNRDTLQGGAEVVITGKNFAPESLVVLGDRVVGDAAIESATRIRLFVPIQDAPGKRTLSVQTRGGIIQREFSIVAKSLQDLAAGEITTVAGGVPFIGDSGLATLARFNALQGLTLDSAGNIFIVDTGNHRIRRIDATGVITTVAGNGNASFSGDGNTAVSAALNAPRGIVFDGAGNLLIADAGNHRVRRVDSRGIITTVVGTGKASFSGDGGPAGSAGLNFPRGVAVDALGNLFIADSNNNRIRRVDAITGIITTIAGNGCDPSVQNCPLGDGGPAANAFLFLPNSVAADMLGNVFFSDPGNSRIRRVDARTNIITTAAGNSKFEFSGDGGPAASAGLNAPQGVEVDAAGNIFIADTSNSRIRRIDARTGVITTAAGNGVLAFSGDGGPAQGASLSLPLAVTVDGSGNLLIADTSNARLRRVDAKTNIINTLAGLSAANENGISAVNASLSNPSDVEIDRTGNLIIADKENSIIRRVNLSTGIINTIAGTGLRGFSGDNGSALNAKFSFPNDISIDSAGNMYLVDMDNGRVRRINASTGIVNTLVGDGCLPSPQQQCALQDGIPGINATLGLPFGVVADDFGAMIISDSAAQRVRLVDSRGIIVTIAGDVTGIPGFGGDGGPARSAKLNFPQGIAITRDFSQLFIADSGNNRIRKVDARTGVITTVAGNGCNPLTQNCPIGDGGLATNASLLFPTSVSVDAAGNLFIADTFNNRVRMVDTRGIITTVAGNGISGYRGDGGRASSASLSFPKGVVVSSTGDLFIADGFNGAVRVVRGPMGGGPRPDFNLAINPNIKSVEAGLETTFNISLQALNGFSQTVTLSSSVNQPNTGITTSLSTTSIRPGASATLTVRTSDNTLPSTFSINVIGTSGQVIRRQIITLNVTPSTKPNFLLSISPSSQTISIGASAGFTISVQSLNGFAQSVNLSATSPNGSVTTSLSQTTVAPGGNSTLTVNTTANTPEMTFGIVIAGISGQIVKSQTVMLNVVKPSGPVISSAQFVKPNLNITGSNFGATGATVRVNGTAVNAFITSQTDTAIILKGSKKKFALKKGANQVTVSVNGVESTPFTFNF